jgi:CBS domain containing-hemolysin-like protein
MMPEDPILWLSLFLLILLGGYFSSTETSFSKANLIKLKILEDKGSKEAKKVVFYIEHFDRLVILTVIGNNIVSVALSTFATLIFINALGDALAEATLWATLSSAFIFYLFIDTIPKSLARGLPEAIALWNVRFFFIFEWLFKPLAYGLTWVIKFINFVFKSPADPTITEADFSTVVDEATEVGTLNKDERELIQSALEFDDTTVKEVFTPMDKVFAIDIKNYDPSTISTVLAKTRFTRIPIYEGSLHHIIGTLTIKNYFKALVSNPQVDLRTIITKPYWVGTKVHLDDLFTGFKKQRTHMAIVVDDKKNPVGIVTMADVLEEIVGQMNDYMKRKENIHG